MMNKIKVIGIALSVVMMSLLLSLGCQRYALRATVDFHTASAGEGIRHVVVETINGTIEVSGDPKRNGVDVRAEKYATGPTLADAKAYAEKIAVEVRRSPDQLKIVAVFPPDNLGRSCGVSFKILLPPHTSIDLKTSNGSVNVTDLAGDVNIKTCNGSARLSKINGKVHLATSNGTVLAGDVDGDVNVQTLNGSVEMRRVGKGLVKVSSTNGDIRAEDINGAASLHTTNASIRLRALSVPDKPEITATTTNGRVRVVLPATVKATLSMNTSNGRTRTDFKDATVTDLRSSPTDLTATLNGGGGSIALKSTNGSVDFRTTGAEP